MVSAARCSTQLCDAEVAEGSGNERSRVVDPLTVAQRSASCGTPHVTAPVMVGPVDLCACAEERAQPVHLPPDDEDVRRALACEKRRVRLTRSNGSLRSTDCTAALLLWRT